MVCWLNGFGDTFVGHWSPVLFASRPSMVLFSWGERMFIQGVQHSHMVFFCGSTQCIKLGARHAAATLPRLRVVQLPTALAHLSYPVVECCHHPLMGNDGCTFFALQGLEFGIFPSFSLGRLKQPCCKKQAGC